MRPLKIRESVRDALPGSKGPFGRLHRVSQRISPLSRDVPGKDKCTAVVLCFGSSGDRYNRKWIGKSWGRSAGVSKS